MVEEVVRGVGLVDGRDHEESGGGSERDDGVERAQRERENGGRVVACEGGDLALGGEAVLADEVGTDLAYAAAAVETDFA